MAPTGVRQVLWPGARCLPCALAVGLALTTSPGAGQAQPEQSWTAEASQFSIPKQPLESALVAYGLATGVQLLYDASLVTGRESAPVTGRFAPQQALQMMLVGTGLRARYSASGAATLTLESPGDHDTLALRALDVEATPLIGDGGRFMSYAARVKDAIVKALSASTATAYGHYDLKLRVWLAPDGTIARVERVGDSADSTRGADVPRQLIGLSVGQPPASLPQPILLGFQARPPR